MNDLVDRVGSLLQSTNLTSQQPAMSASSRAMLAKVRKLVPPMLEKFHKGSRALLEGPYLRLTDNRTIGPSGSYWW